MGKTRLKSRTADKKQDEMSKSQELNHFANSKAGLSKTNFNQSKSKQKKLNVTSKRKNKFHNMDDFESSQKREEQPSHGATNLNHVIAMNEKSAPQKRVTARQDVSKHSNGAGRLFASKSLRAKLKEKGERERLVLWRHPVTTIHYFIVESSLLTVEYFTKLWNNKRIVSLVALIIGGLYLTTLVSGPHQPILREVYKNFWWCGWWLWLGILSSVGLGTGLHTFLLYLGPHIASVTMAGYLCNSVNFPSPPYPDEIICPEEESKTVLSIFTIMSKVRLEAFMWGAGTALGELPPYFMARGARLSGHDPDDEEMAEFEALQRLKERPEDMSCLDRAKLSIEKLVEKVGFFGILACASIPNPLFDLAGITCGHFLVPFWTFFGATIIGKAVIKMHIQKLFVIIAFDENLLEKAVDKLSYIPYMGKKLQEPFKVFLVKQKQKFRRKAGTPSDSKDGGNLLAWLFEKLILLMIVYFVMSIINSLAQNYHKRLKKQKDRKLARD